MTTRETLSAAVSAFETALEWRIVRNDITNIMAQYDNAESDSERISIAQDMYLIMDGIKALLDSKQ